MNITDKVNLLIAKVEILKLKADDYNWQCHTPEKTKAQLEAILVEIDNLVTPAPTPEEEEA